MMLPEKDSVLEKPPHFDPNNIILCFYAALYAATYLLPNFMQEMLGYTATTSGMVFSPAGLCTMIEVPIVGYLLTRGYDPRKMVFFGLVVVASSFWWMSSLNLGIAERDIILPRIVQVLGAGIKRQRSNALTLLPRINVDPPVQSKWRRIFSPGSFSV